MATPWPCQKIILGFHKHARSYVLPFALVGNPDIGRALGTFYFLWVFSIYFIFYSEGLAQAFIYEMRESNFKKVGGKARRASL